ncbi:hypothetical protein ACFL3U_07200 [Pseudomonadota bacterium]
MTKELTTASRRLNRSLLLNPESLHQAIKIISALSGVYKVLSDKKGKQIQISYNVTKLRYPALLQALEAEHLIKESTWWERIKRNWYNQQDIVMRDNARAKPSPCCSNPTSIMVQSNKPNNRSKR